MPILSKNPRDIHPAYKEAVVDSLLNGLSARLAGRGEFYKVIYGTKPSAALMSEFIVPMPTEERGGDEEADPIRISAHGMDFQIRSAAAGTTLGVSLTGAVYVRILPTEDEVKPGGPAGGHVPVDQRGTHRNPWKGQGGADQAYRLVAWRQDESGLGDEKLRCTQMCVRVDGIAF
ncbi:hypothetical protein [Ralstonia sp. GP71]|uniref:hypothetical protein n=1 Tax=Ralstonia sp. GP71 TaxID=3035152 RepID=UPI00389293AA